MLSLVYTSRAVVVPFSKAELNGIVAKIAGAQHALRGDGNASV